MSIIFYGATVEWGTDGTVYAAIPKAKGAPVPNTTRNYVDVTHLQSPGGYREYIRGLRDAGETSISMGYSSAGYAQALAYSDEAAPIYFRVTMPPVPEETTTGDVFEFRGYVEPAIEPTDDPEAEVMITLNLRVTGQPTFTAGTPVA